ncbi:MAG: tetratricopeptide repeat protein [Bacteroidales bacterium]|jgi:hypothetical protein|nr:tetratricopeptide repeat protein [Bacteroidales bacterium]
MSKHKQKRTDKEYEGSLNTGIKNFPMWKPYLILTFFVFILYSNTLKNDYALDDAIVITSNSFTQKGIKGIPDIFKYDTFVGFWLTNSEGKTADQIQEEKKLVAGGRYRPLSLATFAIEIELFGKNIKENNNTFKGCPTISHFVNIILYLLTTLLLLKILYRLFPPDTEKKWYLTFPFIVSLLFIAHPIHTEAVANIKGRDEIMTLLGSLGALWFTLKYFDTDKKYNLLLSGLCMFLGLLSKENTITFLAIIPITIYYFVHKKLKKNLISMIPLIAASFIFLIIRAKILGIGAYDQQITPEIMNNPFLDATTGEKYATIFYTLWFYIRLLFFPHPLTYDYYPKQIEIINWTSPAAFIPLIIYLIMGIYAIYGLVKKRDVISYSIWFYLLPLSIVSNIFFPVGTFMNERFVFISSIGFCIFIGWLIYKYIPKIIKNPKTSNYFISFITILILCLYSVKTISRNKAWKNDLILFTTDVKVSSNSAKSNCSAGGKLLEKAMTPEVKENKELHDELCKQAIQYLLRSIEIYPEYTDALNLLGNAYFEYNYDICRSLQYYTKIFKLRPYHDISYNNSKIVISNSINLLNNNYAQCTPQELLEICNQLLEVQPQFGEVYYLKGVLYGRFLENINASIENLEIANSMNFEKNSEFYKDIGVAYGLSGNYNQALKYLLEAIKLDPEDYKTYINIGITYQQLGDMQNAGIYINKGNTLRQQQGKENDQW